MDDILAQSIVRNYFNFDLVAADLNKEYKRSGGIVGAVGPQATFTPEKCRIRWSYVHLQVTLLFHFQRLAPITMLKP